MKKKLTFSTLLKDIFFSVCLESTVCCVSFLPMPVHIFAIITSYCVCLALILSRG